MQGFLRLYILGLLSVFSLADAKAQNPYAEFYLQRDSFENRLDELRTEFGTNKIIPAEIETECLAALSFYPELKDTYIEFKFGKLRTTMVSRPKVNSITKTRETRHYAIVINDDPKDNGTLFWKELSFNALTGWIGHELGHIAYYREKSVPGIIIAGIRYLHPEFKRSMERQTDMIAIRHDMGFALYEGVQYTFCCSKANPDYKAGLKKYYLSLEEIIHHSSQRVRSKLHKKKKQQADLILPESAPALKVPAH